MRLSLIVAMAANRVIGRDNALPWKLPADLARFKSLTMGHHLLMGRKTYESIGRPLPGRTTVIITRNREYAPPGAAGIAPASARGSGDADRAKQADAPARAGAPAPEEAAVSGSRARVAPAAAGTERGGGSATGTALAVVHSVDEALSLARTAGDDEAFVAGGAEIYAATLGLADRIYLTRLHEDFAGDTRFPEWDPSAWRLVSREDRQARTDRALRFSFLVYQRR